MSLIFKYRSQIGYLNLITCIQKLIWWK